jgi:hypothetical protein
VFILLFFMDTMVAEGTTSGIGELADEAGDLVRDPEDVVRVFGVKTPGQRRFVLYSADRSRTFLAEGMNDGFVNLLTPGGKPITSAMYGQRELAQPGDDNGIYSPVNPVGNWLSMALFVPDRYPVYGVSDMREGLEASGQNVRELM